NIMVEKPMNDGIAADVLKSAEARGERAEKRLINGLRSKAITTSGAGTGAEIMNVTIGSQIQQRLYISSLLAQRLVANEIQMPSDPY
ncbi:hypothetical protein LI177_14615, partial [bacterium 210820-DFI.6.37]|nr:hypothetical protein [bacterium 210820-DFI.6.37]